MKVIILAVLLILVGLILIRGGIDSLVPWRAWFLFGAGVFLSAAGGLGILLQIRRFRRADTEQTG